MRSRGTTRFSIGAALILWSACGGDGGSSTADAATASCAQCAVAPAAGWSEPRLVWMGDVEAVPRCPLDAPVALDAGGDLDAPVGCGTCTCGAPNGGCALPSTIRANAATCGLDSATTPHTSFDPSAGWTGACDSTSSIAAGRLCSGVRCVQSVTIGPLVLSPGTCTPSVTPSPLPPTFRTVARTCLPAEASASCDEGHGRCLATPPRDFRVCITRAGDVDCPLPAAGPYGEKHLFYGGLADDRSCTPCGCAAPAGGTCSSTISIFTDGACATLAYSATVTAGGSDCHDVAAGIPLGSKSATAPVYTAGACAPTGGTPTGAAAPLDPETYCCTPPS